MSFSSLAPLARATLASSSRVGMFVTIPARRALSVSARVADEVAVPTSSTLSSLASAARPGHNAAPSGPALRWSPENPEMYQGRRGLGGAPPPTHTLTVFTTRNNVILTFTDQVGPVFMSISAGTDKVFRKAHRNSYEAAHQAMLKMNARILEAARSFHAQGNRCHVRVAYAGLEGQGRDAVHSMIASPEGEEFRNMICRVEDRTPVKVGGTRARRPRRV
jgi:small subunit ribosomal protein S11